MVKKGARPRLVAFASALASGLLLSLAVAPAASADTTRTLNLSFSCGTGLPYGLQVNTGSGFYAPSGTSYAVGNTKYFTVSISASATSLQYMPYGCANQPAASSGPIPGYHSYSLTAGTSTINASGICQDYSLSYGGPAVLVFDCTISSLTYS
jgi:hypothetical protein